MFGKLVQVVSGKHKGFQGWVIYEYPLDDRIVLESTYCEDSFITVKRCQVELVYSDNF